MNQQEVKLSSILLGWGVGLYLLSYFLQSLLSQDENSWFVSLLLNVSGYATILLPGYLCLRYVRDSGYLDRGTGRLASVMRLLYQGRQDTIEAEELISQDNKVSRTALQDAAQLALCGVGLQVSYLTWGLLQEKIMTREYVDSAGQTDKFSDAQFLVFVNRILAFAVALLAMMLRAQPRHKAPLYKYSYCSLSNIMSSWCQYEALKYVSFPTQVLAKASKIIPVMLMGKVVSRKTYEFYEYIVAVLISLGMVAFLFGKGESSRSDSVTTASGVLILIGYMAFDSFTSNWQGQLFSEYKVSKFQMMAGVNLFSCLLTSVSLLQQGVFLTSLVFMSQFPAFVSDCVILSLCSAVGQIFIYHTISTFGPVVFTIIMTIRQVFAVVLSCVFYGHAVSATSLIGIFIIFFALFLKIYCAYKIKQRRKAGAGGVKSGSSGGAGVIKA
eukprot:TRINITY_DN3427_c0_g1_i5.p1 TRINITY_DN3427_c0_g1~~TRINITY_DN3427_c0_g1_i5.p1  ORF type:complete len:441 (-),score=63.22 TRINITY_DN3427_c0_g1_i5:183-1505(-)